MHRPTATPEDGAPCAMYRYMLDCTTRLKVTLATSAVSELTRLVTTVSTRISRSDCSMTVAVARRSPCLTDLNNLAVNPLATTKLFDPIRVVAAPAAA